MINAIIVDDEINSCESLKLLIKEYCDNIEIVGTSHTVDDAIELINEKNPGIVFLDVQMKNETGFDLLMSFEDDIKFEVIFTTAHSEYAIQAIRFSAADYLLKPISYEELIEAVEKAKVKLETKNFRTNAIKVLINNLKQNTVSEYKIALPTQNGLVFIKVNSILYCEGKDNYTNVVTADGKNYLVSKTLRVYEDLLTEQNFYRIHKAFLINLDAVVEYLKGEGGQVVMSNHKTLDVSRRKKERLLQALSY